MFPRAYLACPRPDLSLRTFETGKFAHALQNGDPSFASTLGSRYREVPVQNEKDVQDAAAALGRSSILIYATSGKNDSPSERDIHTQLAIRYPGVIRPREAPEILVSLVDLLPSLLGVLHMPVPEGVQGRDLSARIVQDRGELPDSVYVQGELGTPREWRAVIRGYDKIVVDREEKVQAMYKLADDPFEQNDLSREPAERVMRDGLLALVRVWMRRIRDGWTPSGLRLR